MGTPAGAPGAAGRGAVEDSQRQQVPEFAEGGEVPAQDEGAAAGGPGGSTVGIRTVADVEEGGPGNSQVRQRRVEHPGIGLQGAVALGRVDPFENPAETESLELGFGVEVRDGDESPRPEAVQKFGDPGTGPAAPDERNQDPGFHLQPCGDVRRGVTAVAEMLEVPERAAPDGLQSDAGTEKPVGVEGAVHVEGDGDDIGQGRALVVSGRDATRGAARTGAGPKAPPGDWPAPRSRYSLRVNLRTICWRTSPP